MAARPYEIKNSWRLHDRAAISRSSYLSAPLHLSALANSHGGALAAELQMASLCCQDAVGLVTQRYLHANAEQLAAAVGRLG